MTRFVTEVGSETEALNALADLINQIGEGAITAKTAAGDATLTVAQLINGVYSVSGTPGAVALTVPTAAEIVAALKNAQVGSKFEFDILNNGDGTVTLTTAAGVTLVGTVAVPTLKGQQFKGFVTNATSGAEAVSIVGLCVAPI